MPKRISKDEKRLWDIIDESLKQPAKPILTKKESRARQEALKALRSGLKDAKQRKNRLGRGAFAEVYDTPGSDYVIKVPSRDSKIFADDLKQKVRMDAALGDLAEPTYHVKTSRGDYGVQKRASGPTFREKLTRFSKLMDTLEENSKGKHIYGYSDPYDDYYKIKDRWFKLRDEIGDLRANLTHKKYNLDGLMERGARMEDIVKLQNDILKDTKKLDKLESRAFKARATIKDFSNKIRGKEQKSIHPQIKELDNAKQKLKADARKKGIYLDDLHEENIIIDDKGKAKIIDTGHSELYSDRYSPSAKKANRALKTRVISPNTLGKIRKYLPGWAGAIISAGSLMLPDGAEAKQEAFGQILGSEGASGPDEREFEERQHQLRRFPRLRETFDE